jgi:hypothetical protein
MNGRDRLIEKAVEIVYSNTAANFPDSYPENPFLALFLWKLYNDLFSFSIETSIYCINRFHEMAPTPFDKGRLLPLSQCDTRYYGMFVPLPTANWVIIRDAVAILRQEKEGKASKATRILEMLKGSGLYDCVLETGKH